MAKRRSPEQRREVKYRQLIDRTARILTVPEDEAVASLSTHLTHAVRINPLAGDPDCTHARMTELGWQGRPIDWCLHGFTIDRGYEELRDSELVGQGAIYLQNSSSWLPVIALAPRAGETILDVCAAPGGKASHIAAVTENAASLVVNDNSRARLMKLRHNLERLHVTSEYSLYDATRLASVLKGRSFDKILLDAPCSGEGLIHLARPETLDSWSVAHIRRLAELQKRLLSQAWQLLRPGGRLVYSTCTMAPEENELVINWFVRRTPDAVTVALPDQLTEVTDAPLTAWNTLQVSQAVARSRRVVPGDGREAFFVCLLERSLDKTDTLVIQ